MEIKLDSMSENTGKEVKIKGWVYNKRSSGGVQFLQIRDGFGFVQVVVLKNNFNDETYKDIDLLNIESAVEITGILNKDERSPDGYEILAKEIKILSKAVDDYPIQKKRDGSSHGVSYLLDNRHFWLRDKKQWAIQKVRNTIINSIFEYLNNDGFTKIDSPIFTPNACEGTTTLFEVPYTPAWEEGATDGLKVYLTQSGQLYLEAAIMSLGKVFDFGPVFRAEKSKTRRHLIEFWMMDAEMAFYEHKDNLNLQEDLTRYIVKKVLDKNQLELNILDRNIKTLEKCLEKNYERIEHKEAIKILQKKGSDIKERDDLGADDETILTKMFDKPIFVEKYPREVKAFYMKRDPSDETRVMNADMLAPEGYGEVIGGSQREDNYNILLERIHEEKLNEEYFKWYLDIRKYGGIPHSGFGIGLERYVAWICGLKHIRETIPFPRLMTRTTP